MRNRVEVNPAIHFGKPCVAGTRIPVQSACQVKEWWPILQAKLRGHYQYYGVSGNYKALCRYYRRTLYLVLKWLNRSGQKRSYTCQGFGAYLRHYPLPTPKIKHSFYTLSFGT